MLFRDCWWVGRCDIVPTWADAVENGCDGNSKAAKASVGRNADRFMMSLGFGDGLQILDLCVFTNELNLRFRSA